MCQISGKETAPEVLVEWAATLPSGCQAKAEGGKVRVIIPESLADSVREHELPEGFHGTLKQPWGEGRVGLLIQPG